MRKATLISVIVVVFLVGSAFGFYLLPRLTLNQTSQQMHVLAFTQQGACSPTLWVAPWDVVLNGHTTSASPSNASLPIPSHEATVSPHYGNLSVIGFYLPNGVYVWASEPDTVGHTGTVTINGNDVVVTVYGPVLGCTSTVTLP